MASRAILRPDDMMALVNAINADFARFRIWVAEDKFGEPRGVLVAHRTRDNDAHGQLELAWLDPEYRTDDTFLCALYDELQRWAKANKLKSMGAMTMRDTPAMEKLMAKLGMVKTSVVYYGQQFGVEQREVS